MSQIYFDNLLTIGILFYFKSDQGFERGGKIKDKLFWGNHLFFIIAAVAMIWRMQNE